MKGISLDKIVSIETRKHDLANAMAAPDLAPDEFVRLSKEYALVEPVAAAAREVRRLRAERDSLQVMGGDRTRNARDRVRKLSISNPAPRRSARWSRNASQTAPTSAPRCSRFRRREVRGACCRALMRVQRFAEEQGAVRDDQSSASDVAVQGTGAQSTAPGCSRGEVERGSTASSADRKRARADPNVNGDGGSAPERGSHSHHTKD